MSTTNTLFADRMKNIPDSFIREILKVAASPNVISFAGGLPNPEFFPSENLALAAEKVLTRDGRAALQYAPTEGYLPLRDFIAQRQSMKGGITIAPEQVIMLNGSQQGLDLSGKLFCNKGKSILMEEPSYLGAIQAFSAYEPFFQTVPLAPDGPDRTIFNKVVRETKPSFFYCIPNFQNPTGYSYAAAKRLELTASAYYSDMLWIEDNPYGEIYFERSDRPDIHSLMPDKTIQLGSFSKIISPGIRLGWALGPSDIIKKMVIAKQASDLHSNNLIQRIIYQYLCDFSLDDHLSSIRSFYRDQCALMTQLLDEHFPAEADFTQPGGGMFLWVNLPERINASRFLEFSLERNVIFVPGSNFFLDRTKGKNAIRLNFSNPTAEDMRDGIRKLGEIMRLMLEDET